MAFCNVIISNSSQSFVGKLDYLSYAIPEELNKKIHIGSFVTVPVVKAKENALVIDIFDEKPKVTFEIKEIEDLIDEEAIYTEELVELIKYAADYYCCNYHDVLDAALPRNSIKKPEKLVSLISGEQESLLDDTNTKLSKKETVLAALRKARKQEAKFTRLKTLTKLSSKELNSELNKLEKEGLVQVEYISKKTKVNKDKKNPVDRLRDLDPSLIPELTSEQETTLSGIQEAIKNSSKPQDKSPKFLIRGVTGSGKTEIYMRLIADSLEQSKSALVLVPEIALAPQLIERMSQRFGKENILVWHSALSDAEKDFTWNELTSKETCLEPKIIIGARSAIWAPIKNLGLIVIDEEHENSYKQESPNPRYDARTLAIKSSELHHCPLVLGSATPRVEAYYHSQNNGSSQFKLFELKDRVFKNPLPEVNVVDMREEFLEGNKTVFSKELKEKIQESLDNKEQAILFLNKRGSASHVFCRTCGYVYNCPNCDSKIVYHNDVKLMICHHCGHKEAHPEECPECGMQTIKFFGLGTQKLEEETARFFPEARIARLDSDNSKIQHNYLKVWQDFKDGNIDILIGTQMIAKGLDLKNLNTVGVISSDINFSQLDYQSEERGFQLLTQVTGRAGRGEKLGSAIFQTYQPERHVLQTAKEQDYMKFYEQEIQSRENYGYPPFSTLVRFVSSSEDFTSAIDAANKFHAELFKTLGLEQADDNEQVSVLGPSPCMLAKLNRKHRFHILVKLLKPYHQEPLSKIKEAFAKHKTASNVSFTIDIDNLSLY